MVAKLRSLGLTVALVFALGGLGYAGGSVVAPQPAEGHHVAGCPNTFCFGGFCTSGHNCGCVDFDDDGQCDGSGKCEFDANCGSF